MLVMITADWEVINIGGGRYTNVIVYSYQNITVFPINRYNCSHNRKIFLKLKIMLRKAMRTTKLSFLFHSSFVKLNLFILRGCTCHMCGGENMAFGSLFSPLPCESQGSRLSLTNRHLYLLSHLVSLSLPVLFLFCFNNI